MSAEVRLGTRDSPLARAQSALVVAALRQAHRGLEVEEVAIRTTGDRSPDEPLDSLVASEGVGLFTSALEDALLGGRVDLAVHSLKDLPVQPRAGLVVAAVPVRGSPADALVTQRGTALANLPQGTIVGTGSPRRRAQLLAHRPDLRVLPIRGNLETRLRKLHRGEFGAVVLAEAGLQRLALPKVRYRALTTAEVVPAPGQGALAVQARVGDEASCALAAAIEDRPSRVAVDAERSFLAALRGGCLLPAGALATLEHDTVTLHGMLSDGGGRKVMRTTSIGPATDAAQLGRTVAERLLSQGGEELLGGAAGGEEP